MHKRPVAAGAFAADQASLQNIYYMRSVSKFFFILYFLFILFIYYCYRCLHYFRTSKKLAAHVVDCGKLNNCAIVLPQKKNKWLSFNNYSKKERLPFVVYADLECTLEGQEGARGSTYAYQHHKAFSVGYYVSCSYNNALSYCCVCSVVAHGIANSLTLTQHSHAFAPEK